MNQHLITIITVSFNAISTIEETILSVINQTYKNIEYIIIDGGSTDGTLDIIKKYESKIAKWISEPDKGIYDAMNKGIQLATGDWINFMNCGDSFYNIDTIKNVVNKLSTIDNFDVVYGNSVINSGTTKYMVIPEKLECITNHLPFCHQCVFVKTFLAKEYPFNLNYRFVADYNFFYQIYHTNHKFRYFNIPISYYQTEDGYTASNMYLCYKETHKINNKNISLKEKINYKLRSRLLNILPLFIIKAIRKSIYRNNSRFIKL